MGLNVLLLGLIPFTASGHTMDRPVSSQLLPTIFYRDSSPALLHLVNQSQYNNVQFTYSRSHAPATETRIKEIILSRIQLANSHYTRSVTKLQGYRLLRNSGDTYSCVLVQFWCTHMAIDVSVHIVWVGFSPILSCWPYMLLTPFKEKSEHT